MLLAIIIKVLLWFVALFYLEISNGSQVPKIGLKISQNVDIFEWGEYLGMKEVNLECPKFLENNNVSFLEYNSPKRVSLEKEPYLSMKCEYVSRRITRLGVDSEIENPLAVARNVYENYYLQEVLLAQSHSPSSTYCYAIDSKSSNEFKILMAQMASCLPNVMIANETFNFDSAGHFQNYGHHACMKHLVSSPKWKYIILLQNADVFIKTPQEISQILGILNSAPLFASRVVWRTRAPKGNITARSMGLFINETTKSKEQLDTPFEIIKSPVHMLLPRNFIEEIVHSLNLTKLLAACNNENAYGTDEYLFATLVSAHFLKLPGQVENRCKTAEVMRYADWNFKKESFCKSGKKRHNVCLLGVEYLQTLRDSNLIIANKAWPEFDFGFLMCLENLFQESVTSKRDWKKLKSYYQNIPHVREWNLRKNGTFNIKTFKC